MLESCNRVVSIELDVLETDLHFLQTQARSESVSEQRNAFVSSIHCFRELHSLLHDGISFLMSLSDQYRGMKVADLALYCNPMLDIMLSEAPIFLKKLETALTSTSIQYAAKVSFDHRAAFSSVSLKQVNDSIVDQLRSIVRLVSRSSTRIEAYCSNTPSYVKEQVALLSESILLSPTMMKRQQRKTTSDSESSPVVMQPELSPTSIEPTSKELERLRENGFMTPTSSPLKPMPKFGSPSPFCVVAHPISPIGTTSTTTGTSPQKMSQGDLETLRRLHSKSSSFLTSINAAYDAKPKEHVPYEEAVQNKKQLEESYRAAMEVQENLEKLFSDMNAIETLLREAAKSPALRKSNSFKHLAKVFSPTASSQRKVLVDRENNTTSTTTTNSNQGIQQQEEEQEQEEHRQKQVDGTPPTVNVGLTSGMTVNDSPLSTTFSSSYAPSPVSSDLSPIAIVDHRRHGNQGFDTQNGGTDGDNATSRSFFGADSMSGGNDSMIQILDYSHSSSSHQRKGNETYMKDIEERRDPLDVNEEERQSEREREAEKEQTGLDVPPFDDSFFFQTSMSREGIASPNNGASVPSINEEEPGVM